MATSDYLYPPDEIKNFIVIPTFNERKNVEVLIPKIFEIVPDVNIMIVDDESPDGTQDAVNSLLERYPRLELYKHNKKGGFAKAYIDAFSLLLGREPHLNSIIMMDADLSHDPSYLPEFYRQLQSHDMVIGSRYVTGGGVVGWEWWRNVLSAGGNAYLRAVSGLPFRDITGGYNGMRAELLRRRDISKPEARGYAFQFVLKQLLCIEGARCIEIPIIFKNRLEGESKLTHHIITEAIVMPWKMKIHLKK